MYRQIESIKRIQMYIDYYYDKQKENAKLTSEPFYNTMKPYNDFAPRNGSEPKNTWISTALAITTMIFVCWAVLIIISLWEVINI